MVIIPISCLVWMLIIYSGHEICVNARDLCIQTRFRSTRKKTGGREGGWEEEERGRRELSVHYPVVEYFLINTRLCLQTLSFN